MAEYGNDVTRANADANEIFGKLARSVEGAAKEGGQVDVVKICRDCGLEVDAKVLDELQIPHRIHVHPWLPWHHWFPWRPLWCWWWHRFHPWYRWCCPWWWHRCHWWHRH